LRRITAINALMSSRRIAPIGLGPIAGYVCCGAPTRSGDAAVGTQVVPESGLGFSAERRPPCPGVDEHLRLLVVLDLEHEALGLARSLPKDCSRYLLDRPPGLR
jgi:hypothetical protein